MMRIKAVLFDFDDTLTAPGKLDYALIRREIGCPPTESMLDYLEGIKEPEKRERMARILDGYEMAAAAQAAPAEGAEDLVKWLDQAGIRKGIFTRNSRNAVQRAFANFTGIGTKDFDLIITRDDDLPVKPHPGGILHAAAFFGVSVRDMLVVGDFIYDIEAGKAAGAVTVWLKSRKIGDFTPPESDFTVERLDQVREICEDGMA